MYNLKKIGIIGSGIVAKSLGNGFLGMGHEVMLGSRDISKLSEWKEIGGNNAYTGNMSDAADFGETLILAVSGKIAVDVINSIDYQHFKHKTVIDVINPISDNPPENGVLNFFTSLDESLMEILQNKFPEANFVKAFNSVGSAYMVNPAFKDGKPSMFICGNNDASKREVTEILEKFG